jgi:hypothetical protein
MSYMCAQLLLHATILIFPNCLFFFGPRCVHGAQIDLDVAPIHILGHDIHCLGL